MNAEPIATFEELLAELRGDPTQETLAFAMRTFIEVLRRARVEPRLRDLENRIGILPHKVNPVGEGQSTHAVKMRALREKNAQLERELAALRETSGLDERTRISGVMTDAARDLAALLGLPVEGHTANSVARRACEEIERLRASPSPSAGAVPEVVVVKRDHRALWEVRLGGKLVWVLESFEDADSLKVSLEQALREVVPHADAGGETRPRAYDCDGCDGGALHHYCVRCLDAKTDAAAEAARREEREACADIPRKMALGGNVDTEGSPAAVRALLAASDRIRTRAAEREKTSEKQTAVVRHSLASTENAAAPSSPAEAPQEPGAIPAPCPDCAGTLVWSKSNHDHRPCPRCTGRAPASSPAPAYCPIHQHYKWCDHNGGVLGSTGYADVHARVRAATEAARREEREECLCDLRGVLEAYHLMSHAESVCHSYGDFANDLGKRIRARGASEGKTSAAVADEKENDSGTGREIPREEGLRGVREADGREDVGRAGHAAVQRADAEHRGRVGGGGDGDREPGAPADVTAPPLADRAPSAATPPPCSLCKGDGELKMSVGAYKKCPVCHGTGRAPASSPAPAAPEARGEEGDKRWIWTSGRWVHVDFGASPSDSVSFLLNDPTDAERVVRDLGAAIEAERTRARDAAIADALGVVDDERRLWDESRKTEPDEEDWYNGANSALGDLRERIRALRGKVESGEGRKT